MGEANLPWGAGGREGGAVEKSNGRRSNAGSDCSAMNGGWKCCSQGFELVLGGGVEEGGQIVEYSLPFKHGINCVRGANQGRD